MIEISSEIYENLAQRLQEEVAGKEYYNGVIELVTPEFDSVFKTTLIIYRDRFDIVCSINDIIPVWWEFNTSQSFGYTLNDFSWNEFKKYLL